ncbi:cyclin-domain-containing protein [Cantharellus anzutake]|uniref:cyclin-domain-containing protein n=1 Tax=Cantharellus anzutake TaxID=1750568 RepID=UPI001906FD12|nr:cyclin-domain-containing protein [Cantharellus anzutake]KAF8335829.1 cyclin-domain-containing protein [Cantharellus anzutake]
MASSSPSVIMVPYDFEDCEIDHLVLMISDMLERLLTHNDKIPLIPDALTRFHSRAPPGITVLDYLRRIVKYTHLERSCLLITLHYIDQMCARNPRFTVSSLTVHRFLITSITVSTKALCDAFCTNSHYAKIGGIKVAELNILERELLTALDWRLTSTRDLLHDYYISLARSHSKNLFKVVDPPRVGVRSHSSGSLSNRSNGSSRSSNSSPRSSEKPEVPHREPGKNVAGTPESQSPHRMHSPGPVQADTRSQSQRGVEANTARLVTPSRKMETDVLTPDPIVIIDRSRLGPGTIAHPFAAPRVTPCHSLTSPRVLTELSSPRRDPSKRRQSAGSLRDSDRMKAEIRRRRVDATELVH